MRCSSLSCSLPIEVCTLMAVIRKYSASSMALRTLSMSIASLSHSPQVQRASWIISAKRMMYISNLQYIPSRASLLSKSHFRALSCCHAYSSLLAASRKGRWCDCSSPCSLNSHYCSMSLLIMRCHSCSNSSGVSLSLHRLFCTDCGITKSMRSINPLLALSPLPNSPRIFCEQRIY